jgi:heme A synthase
MCGSNHTASIACTWRINMFVWSKRLVGALLGLFVLMLGIFFFKTADNSDLANYTTGWITVNYIGLIIWVFVWMIEQARMRGKNFWVWLVPFILAPLPTLMLFVLFLQRRMRPL